jgi:tetratricopeptide (TPR) repeat protein
MRVLRVAAPLSFTIAKARAAGACSIAVLAIVVWSAQGADGRNAEPTRATARAWRVALARVATNAAAPTAAHQKHGAAANNLRDGAMASFREGVEAQRREDWAAAARAYERAVRVDPRFAEAHANLGAVLARLGRYDAAVASYERALTLAPDLQAARINLGLAHFRAGEIARAVEVLKGALARDPASLQARSLLGLALVEAGKYDEAVPHLEAVSSASASAPAAMADDAAVLFALGRAYAARGDPKADDVARRLSTVGSAGPLWHYLQGLLLQHQGRHREALSAFDAARVARAELPGVSLAVGVSLLALGDDAAAREAFEQARAQAPHDAVPLFYLAWVDERAARLGPACQFAEQALSLDPGFGEARALLGKILLGQGAFADAARHLAMAAEHDPDDASIRYLLAQAYQRAGNVSAATREFAEASRLKARQVVRERQPQPERQP